MAMSEYNFLSSISSRIIGLVKSIKTLRILAKRHYHIVGKELTR